MKSKRMGLDGPYAHKLHAPQAFARFRGALLAHEVLYQGVRGLENSVQLGEKSTSATAALGGTRLDTFWPRIRLVTKTWRRSPWTQTARGLSVAADSRQGRRGRRHRARRVCPPAGGQTRCRPPSSRGRSPPPRRSPLSRRSMASRDGFIITRSWMSRQFSPVSFPSSTVTQVPTTNSWWVFPPWRRNG